MAEAGVVFQHEQAAKAHTSWFCSLQFAIELQFMDAKPLVIDDSASRGKNNFMEVFLCVNSYHEAELQKLRVRA
ncbi:unnamed protein product [Nippostrongylus brasiliensis]|uniref:Uncharacterized protein n=1 Tax=Nippostrongylus brasiliensis TaxID=27835 RepID=A0A0N4XV65_NIPBR|nr:unnamed protein product [Nippostrongylus brasiliensis]